MAYADQYERSITDPVEYWAERAKSIDWFVAPQQIVDASHAPVYHWFPDGVLNTSFNALDRHVINGAADRPAAVFELIGGAERTYTYAQLLDWSSRLGGAIRGFGVEKGDTVIVFMPGLPETMMAVLGCARIGAIHVFVSPHADAGVLAERLTESKPKLVVMASCVVDEEITPMMPVLEEAIERSGHEPRSVIVVQRPGAEAPLKEGRDWDYKVCMRAGAFEPAAPVDVKATDPLYLVHTMGTTGRPKKVVRDNGGHAVAVSFALQRIFDVGAGDVVLTLSDPAGAMAHAFAAYGPLLVGATTVILESTAAEPSEVWGSLARHNVKVFIATEAVIESLRAADPDGSLVAAHSLAGLKTIAVSGHLQPETYRWLTQATDAFISENWWQTEMGWPVAANPCGWTGLPLKPGSPGVPMPGFEVDVLDDSGVQCPVGTDGTLVVRVPLPPGALIDTWGDQREVVATHLRRFPGFYSSGDRGHLDEDGYVWVTGRVWGD